MQAQRRKSTVQSLAKGKTTFYRKFIHLIKIKIKQFSQEEIAINSPTLAPAFHLNTLKHFFFPQKNFTINIFLDHSA